MDLPTTDTDAGTPAEVEPTRREILAAEDTAARAFLIAQWIGALILLASFTQFYWVVIAPVGGGWVALVLGLGLAAVGGFVYLRSRRYADRIGPPATRGARRSRAAAAVVAGAGAMAWLLFAFLLGLAWLGVPILPD